MGAPKRNRWSPEPHPGIFILATLDVNSMLIELTSTLFLGGCLTMAQQQLQQKKEEFAPAKAECVTNNNTYFAKQQCFNQAGVRIMGHETAIMAWKNAEFLKVALRLDRGEITKEEAVIADKEIWAKAKMEAAQIAAAEADRRAAASATMIDAGAALLAASQPPPPAPSIQLNCYPTPFNRGQMTCN